MDDLLHRAITHLAWGKNSRLWREVALRLDFGVGALNNFGRASIILHREEKQAHDDEYHHCDEYHHQLAV
jgi:hypothetical protein